MLLINNLNKDPYFNLALEEFLLKNYKEDIFMLWRNENSVIVGKHQNTLAEINYSYLEKRNIKVARRSSGGGTVFHDPENLNFTYIINSSEGKLVDFAKYTSDIVEALNSLGVPAQTNHRHDLIIEGKKISGNAEHIFKNRVLHHGTLLFNSDLEQLVQAISTVAGNYTSKAVQSVKSKVCNIKPYLSIQMNISQFKDYLMEFMYKKYCPARIYELNEQEIIAIQKLRDEKYATWEWIYGYSPNYEINNQINTKNGKVLVKLMVKKGIIIGSFITCDCLSEELLEKINNGLIGLKHHKETIINHLNEKFHKSLIIDISIDKFVNHLF